MAEPKYQVYPRAVPSSATTRDSESEPTSFSGGSGGGPTVDAETQRFVESKVETIKAQNDARFTEVLSRIDGVASKIDHAPKPVTFLQFLLGAAAALGVTLSIVFAVMAYASDRFDGGLAAVAIKDQIATEQRTRDGTQDAKLNQIIETLGKFLPPQASEP